MIIPLPEMMLDALLCSNLLFALLLVIGALHVKDPLKVATLPSLLLMATLWRLSLNLATTRAVLSSGRAGQTVEAFGGIVIQGSVVVGFVLFVLITLIQFIVVAKGAERVAEVSARFTLDAMPGKQMAIDAELRSGTLDPESARRRRNDVQMESRFYGALDGAMKFVKGDAIAGLVIALVNIVGGLAVGVALHDLEFGVAVRRYTVLTIGDGLLSQIPSLLNSVAAGLIVTRVQVNESSTLAADLLRQLGQFRTARLFVGCAAAILGFVPGMPHVVLLGVSALLLGSLAIPEGAEQQEAAETAEPFEPTLSNSVQVEFNRDVVPKLPPFSEVSGIIEKLRQYAFTKWGLVIQRPGLGLWNEPEGNFRILIRGMEVFRSESADGDIDIWEELNSEALRIIDQYKVDLIDDGATRRALDYVERDIPDLVTGVVPEVIPLTRLTSLLRALLREEITTKHLDVILQRLAEFGGKLNDRQLLAEIRIALAPVVSAQVAKGNTIRGAVIEPVIDLVLGRAEEEGSLVSAELVELICDQVEQYVSDEKLILVASKRARAYLRDLVKVRWNSIPVIAHEEIAPRFALASAGDIQVESEEMRQSLVDSIT
jgi:type III secretory pathway component EscV